MQKGVTVWFTGLSGAGKTTISKIVEKKLHALNLQTELLDGDQVREQLTSDLGYSFEDRMQNIQRVAYVANLLTKHHVIVLAAFISPYKVMREYCRQNIGSYVEVYVKCPIEECIRRDVKGLYKKALDGQMKNFTGISDTFEEPAHPEITVETNKSSPEQCAEQIITYLKKHHYII